MAITPSESRISFKWEIGIGEFIAIGALLVSVIALRQSYVATKPHVLVSSGRVPVTVVSSGTDGTCDLIARIPIEISNSGVRAVVLERIIAAKSLPPVIFLNRPDQAVSGEQGPPYKLYLAEKDYVQEGGWEAAIAAEPPFNPSDAKFHEVIVGPGEKLSRFLFMRGELYREGVQQAEKVGIALDLEFDEWATQELRLGFEVPPIERTSCGPVS